MAFKACIVPTCKNDTKSAPNKIFLSIPFSIERQYEWAKALKLDKLPKGKRNRHCCEDHFDLEEDSENWMYFKIMGKQLILKKHVVPHKYIDNAPEHALPSHVSDLDRKRKAEILEENNSKKSLSDYIFSNVDCMDTEKTEDDKFMLLTNSIDCELDDSELNLEDMVLFGENRRESTIQIIENNSRFYLGLHKKHYTLIKILEEWGKLSYLHIMITFKKIRLNDADARLADDFGMNVSSISQICWSSIPKLACILWHFIYFPDKKLTKKTLPIPFRLKYRNVVSILDCLEFEIEKPENRVQQTLTRSETKKCHTIKFLISYSPTGFVNFISSGFGGKITDSEIILRSGYLLNVPSQASMLADRGFKGLETIIEHDSQLVRPPSITSDEFSRENALEIHIERVRQRIRDFELLHAHGGFKRNYFPLINNIVVISCGLINMQDPV